MAITTTHMGLTAWNLVGDFFVHTDLVNNWQAVDNHDHSSGKGVKVGSAGLAANAVTTTQITDGSVTNAKLASPTPGVYRHVLATNAVVYGGGGGGSVVSGDYIFLPQSGIQLSSTNITAPPLPLTKYLAAADYAVAGMTTKVRLRTYTAANVQTSAPTTFAVKLVPIVSSGGGLLSYTTGSSVISMTPTITTNAEATSVSSDTTLPANGLYALQLTIGNGPSMPVTALVHFFVWLELHHV